MGKKRFDRSRQCDFNFIDQPRSWRTFDVNEETLLAIVENKTKVLTKEIANSVEIDISTDICHLWKFGSK